MKRSVCLAAVRILTRMGVWLVPGLVLGATVATPTFSKSHGFYDSAFSVSIACSTAGAQIRYTTDGSKPTASHGTVYSGPLSISKTTCLRAAANKSGMTTSRAFTQTYIFLNQVLTQTKPSGYPTQWGASWWGYPGSADYDMDPDIVNHSAYKGRIKNDLKSLPALSIVGSVYDVFGNNSTYGVYMTGNGYGGENTREIGVSAEMIYPDGRTGFQIDCGMKSHTWRAVKRSLRLLFKSAYGGPADLDFPVFQTAPLNRSGAAGRQGKLILRAGLNQSFAFGGKAATYVRDQWTRDTQIMMSGLGSHGLFVHLYINGLYWGLYNAVERPDARFAVNYMGGAKSDWFAGNHAVNDNGYISGNRARWDTLINSLVNKDQSVSANYSQIKQYIDVRHFCDYIILQWYTGCGDWQELDRYNNFYFVNRNNPAQPTKYLCWDGELTWGSDRHAGWVNPRFLDADYDPTAGKYLSKVFRSLWKSPEFRNLWMTRVAAHCFGTGLLTDAACKSRFQTLANHVEGGIVCESARWGDAKSWKVSWDQNVYTDNPLTLEHWKTNRDFVLSQMTGNSARFINSLKAASIHGYKLYVDGSHGDPPAAPSNLAASALSASQIRLTWRDNSTNEAKFKIDRRISGTTNWVRVAEPAANTTVYTDSGLTPATQYYYMVKASNADGDSAYSNTADATTNSDGPPAPAAPDNLAAAALSATQIRLTWRDNSSNEEKFKIDRRASGTTNWVRVAEPAANTTVYTDSGLAANTLYYYMVKASNAGGDSPYSNTAAATTQAEAPPVPAAPDNLAAAALSATQIRLTWQDNSANE
ncbi:MAG: CotH kinase family protein, partial [Kiritimatiellae bacterium]|nr:CotH kinase family protein [Kiritimatiellia bacterium]